MAEYRSGCTANAEGCIECGCELPLRDPEPDRDGAAWICTSCGTRYRAVLDKFASPQALANVLATTLEFDRRQLIDPPPAIARFLQQEIEAGNFKDRRRQTRHRLITSVPVIPVDHSLCPTGEAFVAVTRDISTTGLAIIHTRAVDSELLVVELPASSLPARQVILRVTRCRTLGRFYEIAGAFIVRMASDRLRGEDGRSRRRTRLTP